MKKPVGYLDPLGYEAPMWIIPKHDIDTFLTESFRKQEAQIRTDYHGNAHAVQEVTAALRLKAREARALFVLGLYIPLRPVVAWKLKEAWRTNVVIWGCSPMGEGGKWGPRRRGGGKGRSGKRFGGKTSWKIRVANTASDYYSKVLRELNAKFDLRYLS